MSILITDFGARRDGDNGPAIADAIKASGGDWVEVPPGLWPVLSRTLIEKQAVRLRGPGRLVVGVDYPLAFRRCSGIIDDLGWTVEANDKRRADGAALVLDSCSEFRVRGPWMNGQNTGIVIAGEGGIALVVEGFCGNAWGPGGGSAFALSAPSEVRVSDWTVTDGTSTIGMSIQGGSIVAGSLDFSGLRLGLDLSGGDFHSFIGCDFDTAQEDCAWIRNTKMSLFSACWFGTPWNGDCVRVTENAPGLRFVGCRMVNAIKGRCLSAEGANTEVALSSCEIAAAAREGIYANCRIMSIDECRIGAWGGFAAPSGGDVRSGPQAGTLTRK